MRKNKGFTLIELLVVIAIIGLLSTLAIVALNTARQKSRDAARVSNIKQIQTALELYYADATAYPSVSPEADISLGSAMLCLSSGGFGATVGSCTGTSYMGTIPRDPSMSTESLCSATTTGLCDFTYESAGTALAIDTTDYHIYFHLEGNTGGLTGGSNTVCTATADGLSCATTGS